MHNIQAPKSDATGPRGDDPVKGACQALRAPTVDLSPQPALVRVECLDAASY